MANFTFTGDISSKREYFHRLQEEVIRIANDPGRMFGSFKGTFTITMDAERPKAEYVKSPAEDIDEGVLKSHIFLLNYTMITFTLKNRQFA